MKGLGPRGPHRWSRELLVEVARLVAEAIGSPFTKDRFLRATGISPQSIDAWFPEGWRAFLAEAGLPYVGPGRVRVYSDDELLTDLDRLERELGRMPTFAELEARGVASRSTYTLRFGRKRELLAALTLWRWERL